MLPPNSSVGDGGGNTIVQNTAGFNSLFNGLVKKNDLEIDITDSQKGLLLDLEHFMVQF